VATRSCGSSGARLQHSLRRGVDWVARIGGEEFAIVLPETGYQQGLDVARKLRAAIAQPPFKTEGKSVDVTASFGLCGLDRVPAGERRLAERVLKIADAALYRSKKRRPQLRHGHHAERSHRLKRAAGENPFIMTQALAGAERLRTRTVSVHMVMHKFCG